MSSNEYAEGSKESLGQGAAMVIGGAETGGDYADRVHERRKRSKNRSSLGTLTDETIGLSITPDQNRESRRDLPTQIKNTASQPPTLRPGRVQIERFRKVDASRIYMQHPLDGDSFILVDPMRALSTSPYPQDSIQSKTLG